MSDMDTDADNTKYLSFVFSSHKRKRRIEVKPSQQGFEIYLGKYNYRKFSQNVVQTCKKKRVMKSSPFETRPMSSVGSSHTATECFQVALMQPTSNTR